MENILNWYERQLPEVDFHRIGLIALLLLVHTCIIVPATLLTICMNGNNAIEFAVMAILVFTLLASLPGDLPAKIVIPLFVVSTLIHLYMIMSHMF